MSNRRGICFVEPLFIVKEIYTVSCASFVSNPSRDVRVREIHTTIRIRNVYESQFECVSFTVLTACDVGSHKYVLNTSF